MVAGGSVENQDDSIFNAATREVLEETGLDIDVDCLTPMYLWESAFPTSIDQGTPSRHHLIIYFHAKANLFTKEATKEEKYEKLLKMQLEEVATASWIDLNAVAAIHEHCNDPVTAEKKYQDHTFQVYDIDGNYRQSPFSVLFSNDSTIGNERLTTGTRYLLKRWYDNSTKLNK